MLVPRHYENLDVLHEGCMQNRAYYIPASKKLDTLVENRTDSDRMQLLNGDWKFKYYNSIYDVVDKFCEEDYKSDDYTTIPVPGVWQMFGYDCHQYTNIKYPFPFDPPYVPQDIPCGTYIYSFEYKKDEVASNVYLNFEGVDSCFYLWVNGVYVGYSQVPHATSEFDLSEVLKDGTNTISVLVLKWCDGSYLDDQDKFRMSGIFRDVYLLKRPVNHIRDYRITTDFNETEATVNVKFDYLSNAMETKAVLLDAEGNEVASQVVTDSEVNLVIKNPILWNAEIPYLYTLVFETDGEVITDHVGIRKIEIIDKVIYLNGQKIKFNGVNRHDSDPQTGFVISKEQLMKDLAMMKQHNFNSIRSSHYPNAPYFYELCDKYGFMVIDEADIEAHGPFMLYYKEDTDGNRFKGWNQYIADDPSWEKSILDRVQLMIERDKNRPCIVIWSMGNEAAYGCNFEAALKWTKEFDPSRITHYESARYRNYDVTYDYSDLDLYSRMYPALSEIEEYLEKDGSKPFLLVEYCHCMGNGPGDFEDYFQMIHEQDKMCGGFVWEWCDHSIYKGITENGKPMNYYGGDHGETVHDSNFCMDGLVYPDRTPHTALLEYKNVHRPARVVAYDVANGRLTLHNYMDFVDLKDYINISYEVSCDGLVIEKGTVPSFEVKPHEDATTDLRINAPKNGRVYLKITYTLASEKPFVAEGHELGFDEILIENENGVNQVAEKWLNTESENVGDIKVSETDSAVMIVGKQFHYVYDKKTGLFTKINYAGHEFLNKPMEINIWRAPTDNDMYIKLEWKKAHYHEAASRAYTTDVVQNKDGVTITTTLSVSAPTIQRILSATATWVIDGNGGISSSIAVEKNPEFPELPRFGIRLFLNKELENAAYYGYGPMESYVDKHRAASHGLYRTKVTELHEDYIRPQENGSHFDCDYVELTNCTYGMAVASKVPFSFNASVYTQEELEKKAHNFELVESDSTVVCIDYSLNGIGSNSCGPKVMDKYKFNPEKFTQTFKLVPFAKN